MKDRIRKYMEYKNINAGELATILEVQRSNISHILNGRNKPGASFIEKMLLVFPDINARWFLTGEGEMLESAVNKSAPLISKETIKETIVEPVKPVKAETPVTVKPKEEKEEHKTSYKTESVRFTDAVDKVILLYKDGTFITYDNRIRD